MGRVGEEAAVAEEGSEGGKSMWPLMWGVSGVLRVCVGNEGGRRDEIEEWEREKRESGKKEEEGARIREIVSLREAGRVWSITIPRSEKRIVREGTKHHPE